jgi:hypothetical protein
MTCSSFGTLLASIAFTNLTLLLPVRRKTAAKPKLVCWNMPFLDIFLFESGMKPSLALFFLAFDVSPHGHFRVLQSCPVMV